MSQYSILASPATIFSQAPGKDFKIKNVGLSDILVSRDASSLDTGFVLHPSDTVDWLDNPLYAMCVTGDGILNVVEGIGSVFSPSDIAAQITGGNTLSPLAVAQAMNLIGVPPVAKASPYVTDYSAGFLPADPTKDLVSNIDVSQFSSVAIRNSGYLASFPAVTDYQFSTVYWSDVSMTTPGDADFSDTFTFTMGEVGHYCDMYLPVKRKYLWVTLAAPYSSQAVYGRSSVTPSYSQISQASYVSSCTTSLNGLDFSRGGMQALSKSVVSGSPVTKLMGGVSGLMSCRLYAAATSTSPTFAITDILANRIIWQATINPGDKVEQQIIMPASACTLTLTNASATSSTMSFVGKSCI